MLFLHWAANTLLQASAFMRSPLPLLNLIAASFCLLTSLWLLSAFGVTKDSSASSFFISPPGGDRQAFLATTWEMYPLRFQVQISRIQRQKQILKFTFFWCWWLVKNYLQVNKSNIQLFLVLCWYLETGQEIHQLKKIQWNNHKGKSKYLFIYLFIIYYLFIYLLFFLGMAFLFFYNSKLGPHLLPLRVPHRHIRFCLFHESSNMAHEIHFLQSSVLTLIKHTRAC